MGRIKLVLLACVSLAMGVIFGAVIRSAIASTAPAQMLLTNVAVTSGATVCTATYAPRNVGAQGIGFFTFADQTGTVQLRHVWPNGDQHTRTAVTYTLNTDDAQYVLEPWASGQLCYSQSSGSTAHVWVYANDQGGQPR